MAHVGTLMLFLLILFLIPDGTITKIETHLRKIWLFPKFFPVHSKLPQTADGIFTISNQKIKLCTELQNSRKTAANLLALDKLFLG